MICSLVFKTNNCTIVLSVSEITQKNYVLGAGKRDLKLEDPEPVPVFGSDLGLASGLIETQHRSSVQASEKIVRILKHE